jgi:hypothetical protein
MSRRSVGSLVLPNAPLVHLLIGALGTIATPVIESLMHLEKKVVGQVSHHADLLHVGRIIQLLLPLQVIRKRQPLRLLSHLPRMLPHVSTMMHTSVLMQASLISCKERMLLCGSRDVRALCLTMLALLRPKTKLL